MTCQTHKDALLAAAHPQSPQGEWLRARYLVGGSSGDQFGGDSRAEQAPRFEGDCALLRDHLAECSACVDSFARACRIASAISGLDRLLAPDELEGGVVAAMNAGHRQERAVRRVRILPRLEAPAALDEAVRAVCSLRGQEGVDSPEPDFCEQDWGTASTGDSDLSTGDSDLSTGDSDPIGLTEGRDPAGDSKGQGAPPELDAMVASLFADPHILLQKRLSRYLRREPAPGALDGRVEARIEEVIDAKGRSGWGERMPILRIGLSLAASLAFVSMLAALWMGDGSNFGGSEPSQLADWRSEQDMSSKERAQRLKLTGYSFPVNYRAPGSGGQPSNAGAANSSVAMIFDRFVASATGDIMNTGEVEVR